VVSRMCLRFACGVCCIVLVFLMLGCFGHIRLKLAVSIFMLRRSMGHILGLIYRTRRAFVVSCVGPGGALVRARVCPGRISMCEWL
jgi:hypothetical protein